MARRTIKQQLIHLRKLKHEAEAIGRKKKEADAAFKQQQARCLQQLEIEDVEALKSSGTLFSVVHKVKGQVEDRKAFVRWALEQDPAIGEFLAELEYALGHGPRLDRLVAQFYEAVMNTELVTYKENTMLLNEMARAAADDLKPMPPGTNWRPDDYISQRAA